MRFIMATSPITLTEVKAQLERWRSHKIRRNEPIPAEINANIIELVKKHKPLELRKKLKISYVQIMALTQQSEQNKKLTAPSIQNSDPSSTSATEDFAKVMLNFNHPLAITIDNREGSRLNLQLSSINEAEIIVSTFLRGSNKC
jgi:hypothetical protein